MVSSNRSSPRSDSPQKVFGPPPKNHATSALPQHGFARNSRWEYLGKSSSESGPQTSTGTRPLSKRDIGDDCVKLDFGFYSDKLSPEARKAWPFDFGLIYSVTLGVEGLQTVLNVRNEGKESFEFQMLLHSYFKVKVSEVSSVFCSGTEFAWCRAARPDWDSERFSKKIRSYDPMTTLSKVSGIAPLHRPSKFSPSHQTQQLTVIHDLHRTSPRQR